VNLPPVGNWGALCRELAPPGAPSRYPRLARPLTVVFFPKPPLAKLSTVANRAGIWLGGQDPSRATVNGVTLNPALFFGGSPT